TYIRRRRSFMNKEEQQIDDKYVVKSYQYHMQSTREESEAYKLAWEHAMEYVNELITLRNRKRVEQIGVYGRDEGVGRVNKKCVVNINGKELSATFYGIFQKAWTHGDSIAVGGFTAGQMALPVAVVDYGEGLTEVNVEQVKELEE